MFRFNSIKVQIATATGANLFAAIATMLIVGVFSARSLYEETSVTLSDYSQALISQSLQRLSTQVEDVNRLVSDGLRMAKVMATTQAFIKENQMLGRVTRDDISHYVRYVLETNADVVGTYIVWEPNAIDERDIEYVNSGGHSDSKGQFAPYWTRSSDGKYGVRPVKMERVYGDYSANSRGIRPGAWYLCPRELMEPCVSDPEIWEVQGEPTLMASIAYPIIIDEQFLGVAGADFSMKFTQQLSETVNQSIYDGAGNIRILSFNGATVSDTADPSRVGEFIPDDEWEKLKSYVINGRALTEINDETIHMLLPVRFNHAKRPWSIELNLPVRVAMAEATELNEDLNKKFSSSLIRQLIVGSVAGLVGLLSVFLIANRIASPIKLVSNLVAELSRSEGDLTKRIDFKLSNELGVLSDSLNLFLNKTHDIVKDTCLSVSQLKILAHESAVLSEKTDMSMKAQKAELEKVVVAVREMSLATGEISSNCAQAADSAESTMATMDKSANQLADTVSNMSDLTQQMNNAASTMDRLEKATEDIGNIVGVIKSISEQTNLLALNASIEAARAGDMGRGFAVVADEVRSLASRTNQATTEINDLVQQLVQQTSDALAIMRMGSELCSHSMEKAASSQSELGEVVSAMNKISAASITIAAAVEEQNAVACEISKNISNISDAANEVTAYSNQASLQNHQIDTIANDIGLKLNRFKY